MNLESNNKLFVKSIVTVEIHVMIMRPQRPASEGKMQGNKTETMPTKRKTLC